MTSNITSGIKTLIELIKQIRDAMKEEKQMLKYKATVAKVPLCIEALQHLVDMADDEKEIEIITNDGNRIIIRKTDKPHYQTFKDKFTNKYNKA